MADKKMNLDEVRAYYNNGTHAPRMQLVILYGNWETAKVELPMAVAEAIVREGVIQVQISATEDFRKVFHFGGRSE